MADTKPVSTMFSTLQRGENEQEDESDAGVVTSGKEEEEGSRAPPPFSSSLLSEKCGTAGDSSSSSLSMSHPSVGFLPLPMTAVISPSPSTSLVPPRIREHRQYPSHRSHDRKSFSPATLLCLTCPVCQKKFIGDGSYSGVQSNFKRHLRTLHSSLPATRFACQYCKTSFTTNGNLTRHVRALHKNSLPSLTQTDAGRPSASPHRRPRSLPLCSSSSFQPTNPFPSRVASSSSSTRAPQETRKTFFFPSYPSSLTEGVEGGKPLVGPDEVARIEQEDEPIRAVSSTPAVCSPRELAAVLDQASTVGELCAALPQMRTVYRIAVATENGLPHRPATANVDAEKEAEKRRKKGSPRGESDQRGPPRVLLSSSFHGDDSEGKPYTTPPDGSLEWRAQRNHNERSEGKRAVTKSDSPLRGADASVGQDTPVDSWLLLKWWTYGCPPSGPQREENGGGTTHSSMGTPQKEVERMPAGGAVEVSLFPAPPPPPPPPRTSLLFQAYALESAAVHPPPPTTAQGAFACNADRKDDCRRPCTSPLPESSDEGNIPPPLLFLHEGGASSSPSPFSTSTQTPSVFRCVPCGRVFASAYTLYKHQQTRCPAAAAIATARLTPAMPSSSQSPPNGGSQGYPVGGGSPPEKHVASPPPHGAMQESESVPTDTEDRFGAEVSLTVPSPAPPPWLDDAVYLSQLAEQEKRQKMRHSSAAARWKCAWCEREVSTRFRLRRHQRLYCPFRVDAPLERDTSMTASARSLLTRYVASSSANDLHNSAMSVPHWTAAEGEEEGGGMRPPFTSFDLLSDGAGGSSLGISAASGRPIGGTSSSHSSLEERDLDRTPSASFSPSLPLPSPSVPPSTKRPASPSFFSIDRHSHVFASATALVGEMVRRRLATRKRRKAHLESMEDGGSSPARGMRKLETREDREGKRESAETEPESRGERVTEVSQGQTTANRDGNPHLTDVSPSRSEKGKDNEHEKLENKEKKKIGQKHVLLSRCISCPVDSCSLTFFSFWAWKKHAAAKHPSFTL